MRVIHSYACVDIQLKLSFAQFIRGDMMFKTVAHLFKEAKRLTPDI